MSIEGAGSFPRATVEIKNNFSTAIGFQIYDPSTLNFFFLGKPKCGTWLRLYKTVANAMVHSHANTFLCNFPCQKSSQDDKPGMYRLLAFAWFRIYFTNWWQETFVQLRSSTFQVLNDVIFSLLIRYSTWVFHVGVWHLLFTGLLVKLFIYSFFFFFFLLFVYSFRHFYWLVGNPLSPQHFRSPAS